MPTLAKDINGYKLNQNLMSARLLQQDVEKMIEATPTGERRNSLTDANIHMYGVVKALEIACGKCFDV